MRLTNQIMQGDVIRISVSLLSTFYLTKDLQSIVTARDYQSQFNATGGNTGFCKLVVEIRLKNSSEKPTIGCY